MWKQKCFANALRILAASLVVTSAPLSMANPEREGTTVVLAPSEIADLKQWVENAKQDLSLLKDDIRRDTLEKRRTDIVHEFEAIVGRSARKENELLMRYTLNRALEIDDLVGPNPAPSELQSVVAFLESTIELSNGFYTDDQKYLEAIGRGDAPQLQTPMALFAYQYAEMLLQFSRTFLNPKLEYQITYKALGWLANDLNSSRNLLRIQFSESITRIARLQSRYPQVPKGDNAAILLGIRQFKWEYRERVLKHIIDVNIEIKGSLERAEKKRSEDARLAAMKEEDRARELQRLDRQRKVEEQERAELELLNARGTTITILEASFARNVNSVYRGNMTKYIRELCNTKRYCSELVNGSPYGDPAPGYGKDFEIVYTCGNGDRERTFHTDANAYGLLFSIDCFHRPPGTLFIQSAKYDHLEITSLLRKQCAGNTECEYVLDPEQTGDPAPMHSKKLQIEYTCAPDQKPVVFDGTDVHGKKIFLSCRFAEEENRKGK